MRWLWQRGIAPEQTLIAGDDVGRCGGLPGGDSSLPEGEGRRPRSISAGVEREWMPAGVVWISGGPRRLRRCWMTRSRGAGEVSCRSSPSARGGPDDRRRRSRARARARIAADARRRAARNPRERDRRARQRARHGGDVRRVHEDGRRDASAGRAALEHDLRPGPFAAFGPSRAGSSRWCAPAAAAIRAADGSTRCCSPRLRGLRPLRSESGTAARACTVSGHSPRRLDPHMRKDRSDGSAWMRIRGRPGSIVTAAA